MKTIMFPGQGSQFKGMGKDLFSKYKSETRLASDILGYDIEELCVLDPKRELSKTQFTQPALYVVSAFSYYENYSKALPDFFIGHSLGEYNALLAAGAFDFETGLRLVQKRGALMAAASGGGMAAVLGLDADTLRKKLNEGGYTAIDVANYNSPSQIVVAGPQKEIDRICNDFDRQGIKIVPLFVTAPFHSRYMQSAATEFSEFLKGIKFSSLKVPVIANSTGLPYKDNQIHILLSSQISSPVNWIDTIRLLMGKGVKEYAEVGSEILTKMVKDIQEKCTPLEENKTALLQKEILNDSADKGFKKVCKAEGMCGNAKPKRSIQAPSDLAVKLGSEEFRASYGIKYSYLAGAMYRGIASKELVISMGKANMMAFLGTGGMSLDTIESNIRSIQNELKNGEAYGMNLLHNLNDSAMEMNTVKLYLKYGIQKVEAAAFMQITLALVYFRLKGLRKEQDGSVSCRNKILAKVSRPEVAEGFMRPAPERLVNKLLEEGLVTREEAELSRLVPVSHDICVEADSGGHTDGGVALVLFPSIQSLRKEIQNEFSYKEKIRIGLAGGIGTPEAVACAFIMGADFVMTGSINQCTVEAGTSEAVKDMLQEINVQDTDYAPAGDMFEIGAKIQVLKKGVLFPARANKLYTLYQRYDSLDDIPTKVIDQLENSYFKKSIGSIWEETKKYFIGKNQQLEITAAEESPKKKMALIFRWYFGYSSKLSFEGDTSDKANFQIHTGPALGAFNQWAKGTRFENWRSRHVDEIGVTLMEGAAKLLGEKLDMYNYN